MTDARAPVALVTGSSRGIGRAIALELARSGHDVAVHYRSQREAARAVCDEIERLGRRSIALEADLTRSEDRARLVGELREAYASLDVLVNNAGAAPRVREDVLEVSEERFFETFHTNFSGAFFLTQAIAAWMLETGERELAQVRAIPRTIVNISSVSEYAPTLDRSPYCVAKAAMGMMAKLFAVRLAAAGVNVHTVRPGVIETDMTAPVKEKYDRLIEGGLTPIRRWGRPEDVARAVRALVGGDFAFATGTVIDVDGGFHMRVL